MKSYICATTHTISTGKQYEFTTLLSNISTAMKKTVILKWNPAFSSYKMNNFLNDLVECKRYDLEYANFDWSVHDHEQIHEGDTFYWVKVGYGQTGIVGHGKITSDPREGEDWYGKGRQTFYVDFEPDVLINPDALPLLTCETLNQAIPSFEWDRGHSGLVLTDEQADKLHELWKQYLFTNKTEFLTKALRENDYIFILNGLLHKAEQIARKAHEGQTDKAGKPYIEHPKRVVKLLNRNEQKVVAWLHDTIEDTDITPEYLLDNGFPQYIVDAILSVTKQEGESYEEFIERAAQNPIGKEVKLCDLIDNLNIMRLEELSEKDLERLDKYLKAHRFLTKDDKQEEEEEDYEDD